MATSKEKHKTTITIPDSDFTLFSEAASAEGAESVLQWLLTAGRKRARMVTAKGPIKLTEVIIPPPEGFRADLR